MARQLFNKKGYSLFDWSEEASRYHHLRTNLTLKLREMNYCGCTTPHDTWAKEMIAGERDFPMGFTWHDLKQLMSEEDWVKLQETMKPSTIEE